METLKTVKHVAADGTLHLAVPQHFANQQVEVILVLQTIEDTDMKRLGYPGDYFVRMDAIVADDVIERGDQGGSEIREPIE